MAIILSSILYSFNLFISMILPSIYSGLKPNSLVNILSIINSIYMQYQLIIGGIIIYHTLRFFKTKRYFISLTLVNLSIIIYYILFWTIIVNYTNYLKNPWDGFGIYILFVCLIISLLSNYIIILILKIFDKKHINKPIIKNKFIILNIILIIIIIFGRFFV